MDRPLPPARSGCDTAALRDSATRCAHPRARAREGRESGGACALLATLTVLAALSGVGCSTYCSQHGCDGAGGAGGATSSSASSQTSTSTSSISSSSTGVVMDCLPTLTAGPKDDTCGVFVDPNAGSDGAAGTMAAPQKTLGAALITWIPGKAIYVCDGALTDTEPLTVQPGVIVYGGLDCGAGYRVKSDAARTTLAPKAGAIPLTLTGGAAATELHQLAITATADTAPGSSAIGVVVGDVSATLERVDITADDGVAGANSTTPTDNIGPSNPMDAMIVGNAGANANTMTPGTKNPGGPAKVNPLCQSIGGAGGDGGNIVAATPQQGSLGDSGSATPLPPPLGMNNGQGGPGEIAIPCEAGHGGAPGAAVLDGAGASGPQSVGKLSLTGYQGVSGAKGPDGNPGQGGGGGGGAKGKTSPDTRGASGGSGGAGGCGGHGAPGGGPGGASLALVLLGASAPTLVDVTLVTGKGGDGGAGAAGQFGATGGDGGARGLGMGTTNACIGGAGGQGSSGGAGGGGRGGHSVGIAYVTALPASGFMVTHGAAGAAGTSAGAGTPADAGVADDVLQLGAQ
ncbi:MAG: hypothetical protein U0414_02980 [Polyangiaceae bacterium]